MLDDLALIRGGSKVVPHPRSAAGDQKRDEFISRILGIAGDPDLLWIPATADTTTSTDKSRHGATITYDATVAARRVRRGSGWALTFDGINDEGDIPDADRYSYVEPATFSVVALAKPTDATPTAANTVIARWDKDTDGESREWRFFLTSTAGLISLEIYDESANAYVGRTAPAMSDATWGLIGATYDGSGSVVGINIYEDGAVVDTLSTSGGTYAAMENTTAIVSLGHTLSAAATPVAEEFWTGDLGFILLARKALSREEMWEIKNLVNSFYDLAL